MPNVKVVVNKDLDEAHNIVDERELQAHIAYLYNQIAPEKHAKELNHLLKASESKFWWAAPIETMNKVQFVKFKAMLEELEKRVNEKRDKLLSESTSFVVNSLVAVPSTPLMQKRVGEIN